LDLTCDYKFTARSHAQIHVPLGVNLLEELVLKIVYEADGISVLKPDIGTTCPENETTYPDIGTSCPENRTPYPVNGTTYPENGTAYPDDGTFYPENGPSCPVNGT